MLIAKQGGTRSGSGMRMNKRGQLFELGLAFVILIILSYTLFTVITKSREEVVVQTSRTFKLMNLQSEAREAQLYIQSSAEFAAQQAFFNIMSDLHSISKQATEGACKVQDNRILWKQDKCEPKDTEEIQKEFLEKFRKTLEKSLAEYRTSYLPLPSENLDPEAFSEVVRLKKDAFDCVLEEEEKGSDEEGAGKKIKERKIKCAAKDKIKFENFFTYSVDPSFEVELEFNPNIANEIYNTFIDSVQTCEAEAEKDRITCLEGTMNVKFSEAGFEGVVQKDAKTDVLKSEAFKIKQRFFYRQGGDLSYEKLELKFAFDLTKGK